MDDRKVLATGTPQELYERTRTRGLESAFIALLSRSKRTGHHRLVIPLRPQSENTPRIATEAEGLIYHSGDLVAVDHVSFRIERGEAFSFLGSNGCGRSTTMKMFTGLLPASEDAYALFGQAVDANDMAIRCRVGYTSQAFSLYAELSVRQNLVLRARLFHLPTDGVPARVGEILRRSDLRKMTDELPNDLPLSVRQRLPLVVAMIHKPEILVLDEPTLGVNPVARDDFWELMVELSRRDGMAIFISTRFMSETQHCDRISLTHASKVLASDIPDELVCQRGLPILEATFIAHLEEAAGAAVPTQPTEAPAVAKQPGDDRGRQVQRQYFSPLWLFSYARREVMELCRDSIRLTLALLGTALLMFIIDYGANMDVEDFSWAVLDRDQTITSQACALNIASSCYFVEHAPITGPDDLGRRLHNGELSLTVEISSNFGCDLKRGSDPAIDAWIDGAMPTRTSTVLGYVQGLHTGYLTSLSRQVGGAEASAAASTEVRYRYNPDVESPRAMVPAVIPLLLIMIPVTLIALGVVCEKELGSITNLYITSVTRLESLVGKQSPYIIMGIINFLLILVLVIMIFRVPLKGSFLVLTIDAFLYVITSIGLGLFLLTFMCNQTAAVFGVAIATMIPAIQLPGLIHPVSSLEGAATWISKLYPTSHFLVVGRGAFSKSLGLPDLQVYYLSLAASIAVLTLLGVACLKEQED